MLKKKRSQLQPQMLVKEFGCNRQYCLSFGLTLLQQWSSCSNSDFPVLIQLCKVAMRRNIVWRDFLVSSSTLLIVLLNSPHDDLQRKTPLPQYLTLESLAVHVVVSLFLLFFLHLFGNLIGVDLNILVTLLLGALCSMELPRHKACFRID